MGNKSGSSKEFKAVLTGTKEKETSKALVQLFKKFDKDESGTLEKNEIEEFVDAALDYLATVDELKDTKMKKLCPDSVLDDNLSIETYVSTYRNKKMTESYTGNFLKDVRSNLADSLILLCDKDGNKTIALSEFEKFEWYNFTSKMIAIANGEKKKKTLRQLDLLAGTWKVLSFTGKDADGSDFKWLFFSKETFLTIEKREGDDEFCKFSSAARYWRWRDDNSKYKGKNTMNFNIVPDKSTISCDKVEFSMKEIDMTIEAQSLPPLYLEEFHHFGRLTLSLLESGTISLYGHHKYGNDSKNFAFHMDLSKM